MKAVNVVRVPHLTWHEMSQEDVLVYLQERGFDVEDDFLSHVDDEKYEMVFTQEVKG